MPPPLTTLDIVAFFILTVRIILHYTIIISGMQNPKLRPDFQDSLYKALYRKVQAEKKRISKKTEHFTSEYDLLKNFWALPEWAQGPNESNFEKNF